MAMFKKSSLFKKSSGSGLFKKSETKLSKKSGHASEIPPAGFPTSEDLRQGTGPGANDAHDVQSSDGRFLNGERVSLNSTRARWTEYEQYSQQLFVNMSDGTTIAYQQVPAAVAIGLINAPSAGRYIGETLSRYQYSVM